MERGTNRPGDRSVFHGRILIIRITAALLCFLLLLTSLELVSGYSHAAKSTQQESGKPNGITIKITLTIFDTPTPTPTNTPAPTATPTHTPTPRPTNTPTAGTTPVKNSTPVATATAGASATATSKVKATPAAVGTATVGIGQTPTSLAGGPTTANSRYSSLSVNQSVTNATLIAGILIFLGIMSLLLIGYMQLRKRLLPQPVKLNLPPSGAEPWKRERTDTLQENMDIFGEPLQNSEPTMVLDSHGGYMPNHDNNSFATPPADDNQDLAADVPYLFPGLGDIQFSFNRNGSTPGKDETIPLPAPATANSESPVDEQRGPDGTSFPPTPISDPALADNPDALIEHEVKSPIRVPTRLVKFQELEEKSSNSLQSPSNNEDLPEKNSGELPPLDDPRSDTLTHFILLTKKALMEKEKENKM